MAKIAYFTILKFQ